MRGKVKEYNYLITESFRGVPYYRLNEKTTTKEEALREVERRLGVSLKISDRTHGVDEKNFPWETYHFSTKEGVAHAVTIQQIQVEIEL